MNETKCHIHFPDSNRTSCKEKSNQVSLSGTEQGVEQARNRVRVSSGEGWEWRCGGPSNRTGGGASQEQSQGE